LSLTPERHEDGEEDGALVVEEVHDLGMEAGLLQLPVVAKVIASRTHGHVLIATDLLTERFKDLRSQ
jgi:hypothetical protein